MWFKLVSDMYETSDIANYYEVNETVTVPKQVGADKHHWLTLNWPFADCII